MPSRIERSALSWSILFLFLATLLTSGCDQLFKSGSGGAEGAPAFANGAGYGGQPQYLRKTLDRIVASLSNYQDGFNASTFGVYTSKTCENLGDPILCERLISPTGNQRVIARTTLSKHIDTLRGLPEKAKFTLVTGPLNQTLPNGELFPVNALAELGGTNVIIDVDAFRGETVSGQVATLVHELLHLADKDSKDEVAVGDWTQTRDLFDFIGTAAAAYYVDNLGKVVTTFPSPAGRCFGPGVRNVLDVAPYFQPPTLSGDPDGQVSTPARDFVNTQIAANSFTIGVWARLDPTDLEDRDSVSNGEALISNFDQTSHSGYKLYGLAMFRYSLTKTFAAYAGTYELLDSGLPFEADGKYHHLVLRKNTATGRISTFVDGVAGNEFNDKLLLNADGDPIYSNDSPDDIASETAGSLEGFKNSVAVDFGIGRAGGNANTNNCTLSQFKDTASIWECLRRFKGNIAAIALYKEALTNDAIKSLYQCGQPAP